MLMTGIYDDKEVIVEINDDGKLSSFMFRYLKIDRTVDRGEFSNLKSLSAHLRADLSYEACCDLLFRHDIPKDSPLWSLNHDGYPSEQFVKKYFPEWQDDTE